MKQSKRADLMNLLGAIKSTELSWFEVGCWTDEECQAKIDEIVLREGLSPLTTHV